MEKIFYYFVSYVLLDQNSSSLSVGYFEYQTNKEITSFFDILDLKKCITKNQDHTTVIFLNYKLLRIEEKTTNKNYELPN